MKRVVQFKQEAESYCCYEDNNIIFAIQKSSLQFNVKDFYQAFYAEDKDVDNIVIENKSAEDKNATRIFECIQNIMKRIDDKLKNLPQIKTGKADSSLE